MGVCFFRQVGGALSAFIRRLTIIRTMPVRANRDDQQINSTLKLWEWLLVNDDDMPFSIRRSVSVQAIESQGDSGRPRVKRVSVPFGI